MSFLEGENPTQRPAESVSLVGRWQLAFCGVNRGLKVLIGIQGSVENGRMLNFCFLEMRNSRFLSCWDVA